MNESSSEGSADEEEIFRNFEEEAQLIVENGTLPKKSSERYLLVYNTYKNWQEENQKSLSSSDESNLIVYFESLKTKLKPTTLWSIWSMLRKTLHAKNNININNFLNLKSIIKSNAKGYKPKKSLVLKWEQIVQFMNEAPDIIYLAMKVIIFYIFIFFAAYFFHTILLILCLIEFVSMFTGYSHIWDLWLPALR